MNCSLYLEVASSTVVISSWFQVSYPIEKHTLRGKIKSDLKTRFSFVLFRLLLLFILFLLFFAFILFLLFLLLWLSFLFFMFVLFFFLLLFLDVFGVFLFFVLVVPVAFVVFAVLVLPPSFCSFCSCFSCLPVLLLVLFFFFLLLFFFSCVCLLVIVVLFPAFVRNRVAFPAQHQQIITGPTYFHILLMPYASLPSAMQVPTARSKVSCRRRSRRWPIQTHRRPAVPVFSEFFGASAGWTLEKIVGGTIVAHTHESWESKGTPPATATRHRGSNGLNGLLTTMIL